MKIYRAVFTYNNNDSNEWENLCTETSQWYTERSLAEQHLPLLRNFKDYLQHIYIDSSCFCSNAPFIEEQEVSEDFVPMKLQFRGEDFKEFSYIPYEGPRNITSQVLYVSFPAWVYIIEAFIGDEQFDIYFSLDRKEGECLYQHHKATQSNSNFYRYSPEHREALLSIIKEFAESLVPYIKESIKEYQRLDRLSEDEDYWRKEGRELSKCTEINTAIKLLKYSHLSLSESSVKYLKEELKTLDKTDNPKYTEALTQLISFSK